ncbi:porin [Paraburkholderia antibiotica]|uniref:Porin n=1 Tax=Paraburkholderia antibiotica TaxID=2728839 RepID=A0A7Y0A100_9BURK|nr:porin [Paraburkholderia antibiotica]NML34477.1 porin [Paraburkholderia antibiotica]
MKKTLALCAALAVTPQAFAQSSVTLAGVIDMGYTYNGRIFSKGGVSGQHSSSLQSGAFRGSRIVFSGTEDLGGAQHAFFMLENGFQANTGALGQGGLLFGRQAYVGLSGNWGAVRLGHQYTQLFDRLSMTDPFVNLMAGGNGNIETPNPRVDNAILYLSPTFHGFSANAMFSLGGVAGNFRAGNQWSGDITYSSGPIYATYIHNEISSNPGVVPNPGAPAYGPNNVTGKIDLVGGVYDFKYFKLHANYYRAVNLANNSIPNPIVQEGGRFQNWMAGVTVPFGPAWRFEASYTHHDDQTGKGQNASQYAVGGFYLLSKRTSVFSSFSRIVNKNGATFSVANSTNPGVGELQFNIGLDHSF